MLNVGDKAALERESHWIQNLANYFMHCKCMELS